MVVVGGGGGEAGGVVVFVVGGVVVMVVGVVVLVVGGMVAGGEVAGLVGAGVPEGFDVLDVLDGFVVPGDTGVAGTDVGAGAEDFPLARTANQACSTFCPAAIPFLVSLTKP